MPNNHMTLKSECLFFYPILKVREFMKTERKENKGRSPPCRPSKK